MCTFEMLQNKVSQQQQPTFKCNDVKLPCNFKCQNSIYFYIPEPTNLVKRKQELTPGQQGLHINIITTLIMRTEIFVNLHL